MRTSSRKVKSKLLVLLTAFWFWLISCKFKHVIIVYQTVLKKKTSPHVYLKCSSALGFPCVVEVTPGLVDNLKDIMNTLPDLIKNICEETNEQSDD